MRILSCVAAAIVLATASFAASADDRDADSWPTLGRDWKQSYYSPLTGINADNISQLGYAWGYDLQFTSTLEATPIVIDGVMYTSGNGGRTYALDALTGKPVWQFPDGQYSPIVADRERVYLVGSEAVFGLVSRRKPG